jgi:hypothetical protein
MGSAAPTAPLTDRFQLTVPASWYVLELSPEAAEPTLRAAVTSRLGRDPRQRRLARELMAELMKIVRTAQRRGAIYAAGTFEVFEDGPVTATVMVSVVTPPPGARGDLLAQLGRMRPRAAGEPDGAWRDVLPVDLPEVGPAGRVVGLQDLPVSDEVSVRFVVMHTVIPIPGSDGALVVTCGSPNLLLVDALLDLFDAITGTFRFVDEEGQVFHGS